MDSWTYARRIWTKLKCLAIYVRACALLMLRGQASLSDCLAGDFSKTILRAQPWTVDRIVVFREPPVDEDEAYDLDYVELHPDTVDLHRLDDSVAEMVPPEWEDWKVEVRCVRGSKKRRVVARRGEVLDVMADVRALRGYRILTAVATFGDGCSLDVHDRLDKYVVVPHRALYPRDLFPFDDQFAMPGTLLVRAVAGTRLSVREYSFSEDTDMRASFSSS